MAGKTDVIAHLVTGGDIESAVIGVSGTPTVFTGGPRDQKATVTTDAYGQLNWALDLETQVPYAGWTLTLTKKGEKEGTPDDRGTTDGDGVATPTPGGIKEF